MTELGIQQYLGLIKNNFHMIRSQKHKDTGRERKLFYQVGEDGCVSGGSGGLCEAWWLLQRGLSGAGPICTTR